MASAIIFLATNQKFNFSKLIFDSMIRNLDNVFRNFLMYPRFLHIFLDHQLDGVPTHKRTFSAPSHTKKIFGNMRMLGKGFSGRVTPLFPTMVIQNQSELGEGSAMPTDPHHTPTILQPSSSQPQKTQKLRKPKRKDTQVPQPSSPTESVADEAVHKELGDSLVRVATTASSLEAEQDSGNIDKTQSKATHNESSSQGTDLVGGPRCQETMGDTITQTRFQRVSKHSNDLFLARGNTLRRDEDRMKLDTLMELCTYLQNRVLDLEKTKTTQRNKIDSLKRRVKKLKNRNRSRTHKLKRLYKVGLTAMVKSSGDEESLGENASKLGRRIDVIGADEDITLVNDADNKMFDVDDLGGEEVFVSEQDENTTQVKGIVFHEPGKSTTTTIIFSQQSQDKGKGIMIEEPVKPKKKDQIWLDEEAAKRAFRRVNTFEDFRLELVERKEKRAREELEQEIAKKQKVEDDKEKAELKQLMETIPNEEEVVIDAISLVVKSPRLVD
nr:hypothetical protein [Tanacetum cinerariifolium]